MQLRKTLSFFIFLAEGGTIFLSGLHCYHLVWCCGPLSTSDYHINQNQLLFLKFENIFLFFTMSPENKL